MQKRKGISSTNFTQIYAKGLKIGFHTTCKNQNLKLNICTWHIFYRVSPNLLQVNFDIEQKKKWKKPPNWRILTEKLTAHFRLFFFCNFFLFFFLTLPPPAFSTLLFWFFRKASFMPAERHLHDVPQEEMKTPSGVASFNKRPFFFLDFPSLLFSFSEAFFFCQQGWVRKNKKWEWKKKNKCNKLLPRREQKKKIQKKCQFSCLIS